MWQVANWLRALIRESKNKKDGYRQLNVRQLGSLRPWDHSGKCYMDRKRIQCLSNALQHVPIYLQPFLRYSGISVASDCMVFNSTRDTTVHKTNSLSVCLRKHRPNQ